MNKMTWDRNDSMSEKTISAEMTDKTEEIRHGFWIHDRAESKKIPGTYDFLPSCSCSVCGCHVPLPLGICPRCDAIMDATETGAYSDRPMREKEVSMPAEEVTEQKHAYWIHHRRKSESYAKGYYSLPVCDCSNCGYTASIEKPVCPNCRSVMDLPLPEDVDAPYEE